MNSIAFYVALAFLCIISLIDIFTYRKKDGYIPSVLTTLFLIVAFIIGSSISPGITIELGILASLVAWLYTDLDMWGGIADFKVFVACSMLLPNVQVFFVFALVLTICSLIIKFLLKRFEFKCDDKIPFVVVILIAYLISIGATFL